MPLLREIEGQPLAGPIRGSNPGFVQVAVVVGAQALKEAQDPAAILCRAIRQLMPRPVIEARRNNNIFVDVERRNDSLGNDLGSPGRI